MIIIYFYKQEFKPFSVSHNRREHWVKRSPMAKHKSATFCPQLLFVVSPYFRKAEPLQIKSLKVRVWTGKLAKLWTMAFPVCITVLYTLLMSKL